MKRLQTDVDPQKFHQSVPVLSLLPTNLPGSRGTSGTPASQGKQKERVLGCGGHLHSQRETELPSGDYLDIWAGSPSSSAWHRSLHPQWTSLNRGVLLGTPYPWPAQECSSAPGCPDLEMLGAPWLRILPEWGLEWQGVPGESGVEWGEPGFKIRPVLFALKRMAFPAGAQSGRSITPETLPFPHSLITVMLPHPELQDPGILGSSQQPWEAA